ncbi:hypothetical protein Scep_026607 [Stephania cephalantha]|uniref:Transmembrane protein n=1 Tax=Stephania cephalantha TaxID=152367 RepID=A0AAP0ESQ8_9MAGN
MHRSASTTRASEEFIIHGSSPSSKGSPGLRSSVDADELLLPMYDPLSDFAKKERQRVKFAERSIHLIPVVVALCFLILCLFTNSDVGLEHKDSSIAARIEGLTIDGDIEVTSSETGLLELDDLDPPKQMTSNKAGRSIVLKLN